MEFESGCVLTGDIVRSAALESERLDAVFDRLREAADELPDWTNARGPERFRGDGWQVAIADPALALRAALRLRAAVRLAGAETRIAAGFGALRLAESLADSGGSAFERSGRALDTLRRHRKLALAGAFDAERTRSLADGLVAACDALSQQWTARQAEVFGRACGPDAPPLNRIAKELGVTAQTVQAHFARGAGPALTDAIESFERALRP